MIPRKIHYCWFGRGEKPRLAQKCIASWKKYCPDYEIIEWNEDNFDVNRNAYTQMCYKEKKYAFLTDYLRLLIVEEHGGIYFDTDVEAGVPLMSCWTIRPFSALRMTGSSTPARASARNPITRRCGRCWQNTTRCWTGSMGRSAVPGSIRMRC